MRYYIKNLVNHYSTLHNCCVVVEDGSISDIRMETALSEDRYFYAIHGFIDIHTHGTDGCDGGSRSSAVKITSYNQAQLLENNLLGELAVGKKADLLLLDETLAIKGIVKSGLVVEL